MADLTSAKVLPADAAPCPLAQLDDNLLARVLARLEPWQDRTPALYNHLHKRGFDFNRLFHLWRFFTAHEEHLQTGAPPVTMYLALVCKRWRDVLAASPLVRAAPWQVLCKELRDSKACHDDAFFTTRASSWLSSTQTLYLNNPALTNATYTTLARTLGGPNSAIFSLLLPSWPSLHHAAAFPHLHHLAVQTSAAQDPASASTSTPPASPLPTFLAPNPPLRHLRTLRFDHTLSVPPDFPLVLAALLRANPLLELLSVSGVAVDQAVFLPAAGCPRLQLLRLTLSQTGYKRCQLAELLQALPRLQLAEFKINLIDLDVLGYGAGDWGLRTTAAGETAWLASAAPHCRTVLVDVVCPA